MSNFNPYFLKKNSLDTLRRLFFAVPDPSFFCFPLAPGGASFFELDFAK